MKFHRILNLWIDLVYKSTKISAPQIFMILQYFIYSLIIIMPPFEEEGVYCFANVGLSVCLSVRRSVRR
jgi:hypothetical protein